MFPMTSESFQNPSGLDAETASVVAQILSDILESSSSSAQSQSSTSTDRPQNASSAVDFQQPTCSLQEEGGSAERRRNISYQTCTMKEILSEILDCTVIRRPSLQLPSTSAGSQPSTSAGSERNPPGCLIPPPEYVSDPRLFPMRIYNIRRDSNDSRMQCTVKEVLSEVLDYTVFKKANRQENIYDFSGPSTSRTRSELLERGEIARVYEVYRALGAGIVNSANAIHDESYIQRSSSISVRKMLPSYSAVLKMGPPQRNPRVCSSCSFIPRKPPPSYAEVEGIWEDSPTLISSESAVFGPDPTYMVCPRCRTTVVTDVQVHRSVLTHLIAFLLCLCLCWPCCLMPYCLRSCNYSHHTCPHCSYYFGTYRPF